MLAALSSPFSMIILCAHAHFKVDFEHDMYSSTGLTVDQVKRELTKAKAETFSQVVISNLTIFECLYKLIKPLGIIIGTIFTLLYFFLCSPFNINLSEVLGGHKLSPCPGPVNFSMH